MDAASALTALGDEEEENNVVGQISHDGATTETAGGAGQLEEDKSSDGQRAKRYLPEHKKPDAAPTFPEKVSRTK